LTGEKTDGARGNFSGKISASLIWKIKQNDKSFLRRRIHSPSSKHVHKRLFKHK
jgi:hypothetical protein